MKQGVKQKAAKQHVTCVSRSQQWDLSSHDRISNRTVASLIQLQLVAWGHLWPQNLLWNPLCFGSSLFVSPLAISPLPGINFLLHILRTHLNIVAKAQLWASLQRSICLSPTKRLHTIYLFTRTAHSNPDSGTCGGNTFYPTVVIIKANTNQRYVFL